MKGCDVFFFLDQIVRSESPS